jgi:hypothetical protein
MKACIFYLAAVKYDTFENMPIGEVGLKALHSGLMALLLMGLFFAPLILTVKFYEWLDRQTIFDELQENIVRSIIPSLIVIFFIWAIFFMPDYGKH